MKFDREVFNVVKQLTPITKMIVFKKGKADDLFVKRINDNSSIVIELSATADAFSFDDEAVGFYDFSEFYDLVSVYEQPEIRQDNDMIIISQDKTKIKYSLSDLESLNIGNNKEFNGIDWNAAGGTKAELKLSVIQLKELRKMVGLLKSTMVSFKTKKTSKGGVVVISSYNKGSKDVWENEYELESVDKEFEVVLPSDIFKELPDKDYTIGLNENIVKFAFGSEKVNVEIFGMSTDI